jgi:ATP-dependent DNA helicase PIF1
VYHSTDSAQSCDEGDEDIEKMYPQEYLNSINCSGLPLSQLKLKIGAPVMVLRNLSPSDGVCNGSRGSITQMSACVLEVHLLSGNNAGKHVFIPQLKITPSETQIPFHFTRLQFPVRLAFAMTINKSQGQSVKHVGLDLQTPVFTHGQFYVAVSRVTSVQNIKVITRPTDDTNFPLTTKNIVYHEILI